MRQRRRQNKGNRILVDRVQLYPGPHTIGSAGPRVGRPGPGQEWCERSRIAHGITVQFVPLVATSGMSTDRTNGWRVAFFRSSTITASERLTLPVVSGALDVSSGPSTPKDRFGAPWGRRT